MNVNGEELKTIDVFKSMMTVPDCIVTGSNKLGHGHGEAKLYIASKEEMYAFYGSKNFKAKCFMLRSDLISYMTAIKPEYFEPSQNYAKKDELPALWNERMQMISALEDVIFFTVEDQAQIAGQRGYINSTDNGYHIIRKIALPLVSYIYVAKVGSPTAPLFYWKLFVDFDAIWQRKCDPLVFSYAKTKPADTPSTASKEDKAPTAAQITQYQARIGQGKYREQLLQQCPFCPITMIADERLLIASHIKPWSASNSREKVDPYNGYILSPMYDKLFDRGFITFTDDRRIVLSEVISPYTWRQIGLKNSSFVKALPMDEKRMKYLGFHREFVFKGTI